MRTKTKFHCRSPSNSLKTNSTVPFRSPTVTFLIHVKAFDLMERRIVRRVGIVAAINAARDDDANGRRLLFHHANLHRRSMRAEQGAVWCVSR